MSLLGTFWGIGVGPGPSGYIPLAAVEALQQADIVYAPRAHSSETSVALQCLTGIAIAQERIREIEFTMDPDRTVLSEHYAQLAETIAVDLRAGLNVAYLTIGDSLTYSTYGYILAALREYLPDLPHRTFPGITSYAAAASAMGWPLGVGKERTLILPCPGVSAGFAAPHLSRHHQLCGGSVGDGLAVGHRQGAHLDSALPRRCGGAAARHRKPRHRRADEDRPTPALGAGLAP